MKQKILASVILLIGLTSIFMFDLNQLNKYNPQRMTLYFDDLMIQSSSIHVEQALFFSWIKIPKEYSYERLDLELTSIRHQLDLFQETELEISNQEHSWIQSSDEPIRFEKSGEYTLKFIQNFKDEIHQFYVDFYVDIQPSIDIDLSDITQGQVLRIDIHDVLETDTITVESHFMPSLIYHYNDQAVLFLPIAYREEAKLYPLLIKVNDLDYAYELNVQAYDFKEIHFTVPQSTVSSTVGNQDAVIEYRTVIYPTYESAQTKLYFMEPFIMPVENARISSTFGEMRFVNDTTTPTRHAGIDYAIECGTPVYASNAGYVEVAQFLTMIGNTIVIDHGLGLKTYYEHMEDIVIQPGEWVERGQLMGHVGTTGYSTGCHLHFQAMIKNQSFNPDFLYQLH